MESDSSSLIPIGFLAIALVALVFVKLAEASLAAAERLERLQQVVTPGSPRPRLLRALDNFPLGASRILAIFRYVSVATAVVSSTSFGLMLWNGSWFAATGASAIGLILVAVMQLLVGGRSTEANGTNGNGVTTTPEVLTSDLNLAVDSEGEPLEEFEVQMIRGVVQLDTTTAREIMIPRVDMIAVEIGMPLSDVVDQMMESGHSRLPVYKEDLDHIEGLVYARDVLNILNRPHADASVLSQEVLRDPLFIPETKTLEELLSEFQQKRVHIAIVIDEYGGVEGLVTIEDLLEEIVGEIQDEFDTSDPEVEQFSDTDFIMDARVGIDDLRKHLDVMVEADGFDTVGGLVYHRLGKMPSVGDTVAFDGMTIEVVSTVGRRLKKLRVSSNVVADETSV